MAGRFNDSFSKQLLILAPVLLFSALPAFPQGALLPPDINPDTLSRLSPVNPQELDDYGKRIYDRVVGLDNPGPVYGPAAFSTHMPRVADGMDLINQYLRYDSGLGRANIETAILVAAREFNQQYEWAAHEPAALAEGVSQAAVDAIKYNRGTEGLEAEAGLIIRYGRQVLREHTLDAEVWQQAVAMFGQQGALEIAAIMGDYAMAAIVLNAIDQHIPAERPARMPIPQTQ